MPRSAGQTNNGYAPQSNGYVPAPSYIGAGGGAVFNGQATQTDDDVLEIPVINWVEEEYGNDGIKPNKKTPRDLPLTGKHTLS